MRDTELCVPGPRLYVPENSCLRNIRSMFNDKETSDIVFAVESNRFYAHAFIIKMNAPEFAELCSSCATPSEEGAKNTVRVKGVSSRVLFYVLAYIYGLEIPWEEYERLAYAFIEAANKLGGLDSLRRRPRPTTPNPTYPPPKERT